MVKAIIHANNVDGETLNQIFTLCEHLDIEDDAHFMPDTHFGNGGPIGTVLKFGKSICPAIVGVDIGCGMRVQRLGNINIDFAQLDADIKRGIPLGMRHREAKAAEKILTHYSNGEQCGKTLKDVINSAIEVQNRLNIRKNPVENQLGTLGGGNHFVEIGKDNNDEYWLTVHSGSRNFGLQVADYYQRKAKEITPPHTVPKGLESLPMDEGGKDYLKDMQIAQEFAAMNREVMARMILRSLGVRYVDEDAITCTHNYISPRDNICRKGAISAYYGEDTIIPLNMQIGTIYAKGKGNKNYLYSAPHGAGRLFSRGEMKRKMRSGEYTVEDFQSSMSGIYTTTADASTIDESPMAYKPFDMIKPYLEETVDIIEIIKPVYNLKAQGD
jgi:tRNA-splicing ligase RtcB (3'-phosphate/5'-hydroxy nucleic acid ligase)